MFGELLLDLLRPYNFRGKFRVLSPFVPAQGERSVSVCGQMMVLDLSEFIQRKIYIGGYEAKETALVRRWLRPGMSFVDVGANVGYYTALAASLVGPTGKVVAVEPSPAYVRLAELVERNRLAWVSAFRLGLSDKAGRLPIYLGNTSNYTPTMVAHAGLAPLDTVPVCTLDELTETNGIERIDLLKIDVEGHEAAVLRGARRLFERQAIRAILCEFNEYWLQHSGSSCAELGNMLAEVGFEDATSTSVSNHRSLENRFLVLSGS